MNIVDKSLIPILLFLLCMWVYVCTHILVCIYVYLCACASMCEQWGQRATCVVDSQCCLPYFKKCLFLGASLLGEAGRPASPREPPVSSSLALEIEVCECVPQHPALCFGFPWEWVIKKGIGATKVQFFFFFP